MTANGTATPTQDGASGLQAALPGARAALILLLAINMFNFIDRQVLAAVEPEIRVHLFPGKDEDGKANSESPEAKAKTGLLSSGFLVTYMITAPLFGWLAGFTSRWLLVGIGVILWSLASGASGVDWHAHLGIAFWILLLTRCFVGVGEGAYGPIAPTMLSDLYPVKDRGRILAFFYLAMPVGGALGYSLGELAKASWGGDLGWRMAFYLVVPPGLVLGVMCLFKRDPPRGGADAAALAPAQTLSWGEYFGVLKIPSYTLCVLGMTAMSFAMGALAFWMPSYLEDYKAEPVWGLGPRTFFGVLTAVSGLLGTLLGGIAGDTLRKRFPGSYFLVSGVAMIVGFPMVILVVITPFPLAWVFVFFGVFCLFFNTGPSNTIIANVTHPAVRASAFALMILIMHALGDVISPPIIGYVAGLTNMKVGFVAVSVMMLVGGVFWIWGARYLERDTARAPMSRSAVERSPEARG
jgi:MFS family permease